jgi:hypothetical protein
MMRKKYLKPVIYTAVAGLLIYNSVYFKKLGEVKNKTAVLFDAAAFSKKLWAEQFPVRIDSAVDLVSLINDLSANPEQAFDRFTNALAIGNYRYALVKFKARVNAVTADEIEAGLPLADSVLKVDVATEFIYGNAIRDASKLLAIKDFPNTNELNNISEELNKIVRTEVIAPFRSKVKQGDSIEVTGAIELNKAHINWKEPEIIPVRLQIMN